MNNEPTIKEQYRALMEVVPGFTVIMVVAFAIAMGKFCYGIATKDYTFQGAFGQVGGTAWFISFVASFPISVRSSEINAREAELMRTRHREVYGSRH